MTRLTLNADGSYSFPVSAGFNSTDGFTQQTNGSLDSNVATVVTTVNPVNDGPAAVADAGLTEEQRVLKEGYDA
jgi:hypothetical protein